MFDLLRATAFLSADVQNLLVTAPSLLARGDRLETCDQGGNLQTTITRPATHPQGPLVRQQFNDCRTVGVLLRGVVEISPTRQISESADQPWAGSVRFTDYRVDSTTGNTRQRRYDGVATAEGSLGVGALAQGRTMRLTDFTLQDAPNTLGRAGLVSTTSRLDLRRVPESLGETYTLEGGWAQRSGALSVTLMIDAGSQLSLVQNADTDVLRGTITWTDATVPAFSGRFSLKPSANRSAVRVELDLGADGTIDRDAVHDRYGSAGIGL